MHLFKMRLKQSQIYVLVVMTLALCLNTNKAFKALPSGRFPEEKNAFLRALPNARIILERNQ